MKRMFQATAIAGLLMTGIAQAQTPTPGGPAGPATGTTSGTPALGTTSQSAPPTDAAAPAAVNTSTAPSRTPAAPVPGSNSFTESQARGHIADAGLKDVQGLAKDAQGVWRGTATKDGKNVTVALDYQGNVVTQ